MGPGHVQHQLTGPPGIAVSLEFRVYLIADVAVVVCVEVVPDADADFSNGDALCQNVVIVEGDSGPPPSTFSRTRRVNPPPPSSSKRLLNANIDYSPL